MKTRLDNSGIWLIAQSRNDGIELDKLWARGHLHLVCKAGLRKVKNRWRMIRVPGKSLQRILLTPSLIRWQRPNSGRRSTASAITLLEKMRRDIRRDLRRNRKKWGAEFIPVSYLRCEGKLQVLAQAIKNLRGKPSSK